MEHLTDHFTRHIHAAALASIPRTSGKTLHRPLPWWNADCGLAKRNKKVAFRRYQRTKLPVDKIEYNRLKAIARRTYRHSMKQSWQSFVSTITTDTPMSKIWKKIAKIRGRWRGTSPPTLIDGDTIVVDESTVANRLGEHFAAVSSSNFYTPEFLRIKDQVEHHINFNTAGQLPYNEPITSFELTSMIRASKNTAAGPDQIHYSMLKMLPPSALNFLLNLFNKIWLDGTFPSTWRNAVVLPFLKPNKKPGNCSHYRPLALTSCICKLLEKIVNARLVSFLESNDELSQFQYGFRRMRSTADALVRLETAILESFANKNHLVAVFFDIVKAYDTTWRFGILRKLHYVGVRGALGFFISNFLHQRNFKVQIGTTLSNNYVQEQGVPQGCVLSVTLFALAINDVTSVIPPDIKYSLYVDDLAIFLSSPNIRSIERRLQYTINRIHSWSQNNGFQLSIEKTTAVHFHRKRGLPTEPSLLLNNHQISFNDHHKFLGLIFDQRLRWSVHIDCLKVKCMQAMQLLKTLSHTSWGGDRVSLLRIYRSIVRSKLDYGSFIYASASPGVLQKLDPVHNLGIRLCIGAFRSSPVVSLCAESGEPNLEYRRQKLSFQFFTRAHQLRDTPTYKLLHDNDLIATFTNHDKSLPFSVRVARFLDGPIQYPAFDIMPTAPCIEYGWRLLNTLCLYMTEYRKSIPPHNLCSIFADHVSDQHSETICIYTDGSKGPEGVGCAFVAPEHSQSYRLNSSATVFTAELYAILQAIIFISQHASLAFTIFTDSTSSLHAIFQYNNPHPIVSQIQRWLIQLHSLHKTVHFCWSPAHVGIVPNEEADAAARNVATHVGPPHITAIPHRDYYPVIRALILNFWNDEWTNTPLTNKLRSVKDSTSVWQSSNNKNRRYEVVLARLRIGHTLATHQYLVENRPPPYCGDCVVPLTVKHILLECPSLVEERTRYLGTPGSLDQILNENSLSFNINNIMNFLKHVNYYTRL